MVASMVRHFESLRLMRRDNAWIATLLQEAENEVRGRDSSRSQCGGETAVQGRLTRPPPLTHSACTS